MSGKVREILILSVLMLICHISELGNCEPVLDCGGQTFLCLTSSSYASCVKKLDGTYETITMEVIPCPNDKYCDNADEVPCDRLEEPATEEPATEEPTTEEPTTEEPTTEEPATEEPTTEEPTTIAPVLGELVGYTCAGVGRYPHPTDCHRYIYCNPSGLNRQIQCQNGFAYQPNDQSCRADQTPCDNMDFKCVATGRFANPLNPSKYIWCLKINGAYLVLNYSCTAGKIYDGKNACVVPILS